MLINRMLIKRVYYEKGSTNSLLTFSWNGVPIVLAFSLGKIVQIDTAVMLSKIIFAERSCLN